MSGKYGNWIAYCILAGMVLGGCDDSSSSGDKSGAGETTAQDRAVCGNGIREGDEVCDRSDGVPVSCAEFDPSREWIAGAPACADDCSVVTSGTCVADVEVPAVCGNGVREGDEVCDRNDGVPASCAEFDPQRSWLSDGRPACAADCSVVTGGTCVESLCGDGKVGPGEVCDPMNEGLITCTQFDSSRSWEFDGNPVCRDDCSGWEVGSCREEPKCGDGIVTKDPDGNTALDEVCDGTAGVPATCEEYMPDVEWKAGGAPGCSTDCRALVRGTCRYKQNGTLTFMNYNVLFEYNSNGQINGGKEDVPARAQHLYDVFSKYKTLPDIISIVEASPKWHSETSTELFHKLGYEWADNEIYNYNPSEPRQLLCDVLYNKEKYELISRNHMPLYKADGQTFIGPDKAIVFYAVLRETQTDEIFIPMATHWDANNLTAETSAITDTVQKIPSILSDVIEHELNRLEGARQSVELIGRLRDQYPRAHVIYAGDFNTIDLDILLNSDILRTLLGSSKEEIVSTLNNLSAPNRSKLPADTPGSHDYLEERSGLTDARTYALTNGIITSAEDLPTSSEEGIPAEVYAIMDSQDLKIVIDYALFSGDNLDLVNYHIPTGPEYVLISDHNPVITTYEYYIEN